MLMMNQDEAYGSELLNDEDVWAHYGDVVWGSERWLGCELTRQRLIDSTYEWGISYKLTVPNYNQFHFKRKRCNHRADWWHALHVSWCMWGLVLLTTAVQLLETAEFAIPLVFQERSSSHSVVPQWSPTPHASQINSTNQIASSNTQSNSYDPHSNIRIVSVYIW